MKKRLLILTVIVTSLTMATGCAPLTGQKAVSSSLVDFLYPKGGARPELHTAIPNLRLPLRVGLAFVPAESDTVEGLSEAHRALLLGKVKASFSGREYIHSIQIIPDTYMRSARGFETVDQLARLFGLDVIALLSYDQVANNDPTKASVLYWTIVGAYFIKGNRNDVQTFVDSAVFDVRTHKLLFRAPGTNTIKETTTLVNSRETMRKVRASSFELATDDMTANLDRELDRFKERIKEDQSVRVSHREGYTGGGGAFDPGTILLLLVLAIGCRFRRLAGKPRMKLHFRVQGSG